MLELRISLKTETAALTVARRTKDQLTRMRRTLDAITYSIEHAGHAVNPDFEFHRQIALAADNRHFTDRLG